MKKTLALVLAAILTLSLCACGGSAEEGLLTTEKPQTSQVAGTPTDLPDETPEATGTPEESAAPSAKPTAEPVQKPAATQKPTATQKPAVTPAKTAEELKTLMAAVVDGTDAIKMASTDEVSRDSFKDIVGIDYADGYTAVVYQPMISSVAVQVVLFSAPSDADIGALAAQIKANANPSKWVCVTADAVGVAVNGNTVLFYMVDSYNYPNTVDKLESNFAAA